MWDLKCDSDSTKSETRYNVMVQSSLVPVYLSHLCKTCLSTFTGNCPFHFLDEVVGAMEAACSLSNWFINPSGGDFSKVST